MAELGDKVRDRINGFTGIVTGRFEYLNGCVRLAVDAIELKDGRPIDSVFIDESQVEVIAPGYFLSDPPGGVIGAPGGPRPAPPLPPAPRR